MKQIAALILTVLCLIMALPCVSIAEGVPQQQRVEMSYEDTTQDNKSIIRQWSVETADANVSNELNGILNDYRDELAETLEKAGNKTTKNSRLDLDVRYSRTGASYLSFLATARVTYHRVITKTQIQSRTYDMATGERIALSNLFDDDSEAWAYIKDEVEKQVSAYFPDEKPDAQALSEAIEDIANVDFTLHAVSMVLHYPAQLFYPKHNTLIEVNIMYPDIVTMMSDEGQTITDNSGAKMIALTYDDGPMRTPTTKLLNKLKQYGARATFFVIGNRIAKEQDLVQKEHDEGHAIAAHNWTHGDVTKISAGTIRSYRVKFDKALTDAIGIPSRYDRVPYGLYPQMVKAKAGWPYIQWSVDTYDWRGRKPKAILSNIRKEVTDGDIILFHDIKELSADIADLIIPFLMDEGFMFVTIDELFARDGVVLENENVYYKCVDGDTSRK